MAHREGNYEALYAQVLEDAADDDMAYYDVARARSRVHESERDAYEFAVRHLSAQRVERVDRAMPWLFAGLRNHRLQPRHCDCAAPSVLRDGAFDVCELCGVQTRRLDLDAENDDYDEDVYRAPPRKYSRENRFRLALLAFERGCQASASQADLALVQAELARRGQKAETLDCVQVRKALRALKRPDLYPIAPGITAQVAGLERFTLAGLSCESLRAMYRSVDKTQVFPGRKYMPSYAMVMLELLRALAARGVVSRAFERQVPALSHARTHERVRRACAEAVERACA